MSRPSSIGVLGGTFDPVHLGHLSSARQVAAAFSLDRVLLVLCANPYHKPSHEPATIEHRWAMLQLATRDEPSLVPSDIETRRPGPSYSVETLATVRDLHPDAPIYFIVGIDAYADVETWHQPERLLELANIVVTTRPGHALPPDGVKPPIAAQSRCCYDPSIGRYQHTSGHRLIVQTLDGFAVSSSEVRDAVAVGRDVNALTGCEVATYIHHHRLYTRSSSI